MICQHIENCVGSCPSVKDVPHDMQGVYCQFFNQFRNRRNKFVTVFYAYKRFNNLLMIHKLVIVFVLLGVKQFIYDKAVFFRHGFPDSVSWILRREKTHKFYKSSDSHFIPVIIDFSLTFQPFKLFFRVVNQCAEFRTFLMCKFIAKQHFYFLPYNSRTIVKYMEKCLIFSMQVTHEMFRSFRQVKHRLQIYYFRTHCTD